MEFCKKNTLSIVVILLAALVLRLLTVSGVSGSIFVVETLKITTSTNYINPPFILAGLLSTLGVILLTYKLFPKENNLALFAGLFFAVNPWAVGVGGNFHPEILAFTLIIWGSYFLLGKKYLISIVLFSLSLLISYISLILVPILILLFYIKFKIPRYYVATVLLLSLGVGLSILGNRGYFYNKYLNLFSEIGYINNINELRGQLDFYSHSSIGRLFYNKSYFGVIAINNYLNHFDPSYLFARGDRANPAFASPILLVFLPFTLLGLYRVFNKLDEIAVQTILLWLLLSAAAGIFLINAPQNNIFLLGIFPLAVITAFGLVKLNRKSILLFLTFLILNIVFIAYQGFKHGV